MRRFEIVGCNTLKVDLQTQWHPYKISTNFPLVIDKMILKFIQKFKKLTITKTILKRTKLKDLHFPFSKLITTLQ